MAATPMDTVRALVVLAVFGAFAAKLVLERIGERRPSRGVDDGSGVGSTDWHHDHSAGGGDHDGCGHGDDGGGDGH